MCVDVDVDVDTGLNAAFHSDIPNALPNLRLKIHFGFLRREGQNLCVVLGLGFI